MHERMGTLIFVGCATNEDVFKLFPKDRGVFIFTLYHSLFDVFIGSNGLKILEHDSHYIRKIGRNDARRMLEAAHRG